MPIMDEMSKLKSTLDNNMVPYEGRVHYITQKEVSQLIVEMREMNSVTQDMYDQIKELNIAMLQRNWEWVNELLPVAFGIQLRLMQYRKWK